MTPTWQTDDGSLSLHRGDCRTILPSFDAESFTAAITDPPYELGFMGKRWDASGVAFQPQTWAEVLRVLKPGAILLAFGGTRTYHRMTCAIEDAGFEIRDCIMWVYGSGFPKSLDISKAIDKAAGVERERIRGVRSGVVKDCYAQDAWSKEFKDSVLSSDPITDAARLWNGYGTALKPAVEPIVVAMKPLSGTFAQNALEHGVAGLNVDGCRVGTTKEIPASPRKAAHGGDAGGIYGEYQSPPTTTAGWDANTGRWPANIIHDGSEEVLAGFPSETGYSSGTQRTTSASWLGSRTKSEDKPIGFGDSGSAARFFYAAKASRKERGEGNKHPTVKPLALMEYLVKLVTMPTGTRILDPFAGSGTTLLACYNAFVEAVGIDLEVDHVDISGGRISAVANETPLFEKPPAVQRNLLEVEP